MNRTLPAIGLLLMLLGMPVASMAQSSASSSSAPNTLYTRIKEQVRKETSKGIFDDEVVTFLKLTYQKKWNLNEQQIKDVLQGNSVKACGAADEKSELRNRVPCATMTTEVIDTATREQRVRSLGRNLTTLIAGYELPLSDLPERTLHLSSDLLGILNMWSAGTGSVLQKSKAPAIRTVTPDENKVRPKIEAVAKELKKLPPEEQIAAVWEMRSGVRLFLNRRNPTFPEPTLPGSPTTDTERQYLNKHWPDLEQKLSELWDEIRAMRLAPPLSSTEAAYAVFPEKLIKDTMPDNIIVWARIDGDANNMYGDAGLDWSIPLEPVFPSLKKQGKDEAIPGGTFPPEPVIEKNGKTEPWNGMTLCSNPLARRGYLCRPFETTQPGERCPIKTDADDDTITLVHCTVTGDKTKSNLQWCSNKQMNGTCKPLDVNACKQTGGVACGTLEDCQKTWNCTPSPAPVAPTWCCLKNNNNMCAVTGSAAECVQRGGSPSQDEQGCVQNGCDAPTPPDIRYTTAGSDVCRETGWKNSEPFDPQTQCRVSITCSQNCTPGVDADAYTGAKAADGTIPICMNQKGTFASTYLLYHELIHAYQKCALPPGTPIITGTTKEEKTERCCRAEGEAYGSQCAMMERDGLFMDANNQPIVLNGIPMNAQTCTEVWADFACGKQQGLNGCFTSYAYSQTFIDAIVAESSKNPKNVSLSCSDAINAAKMDPRVKALKELVEKRDDICKPGTTTEYKNRIGNNICYIGQCVEQSLELHRLTAGQSAAVTEGATAPWQEPITGTPLGNLLSNPPLSQYSFPLYRPELLVNTLDAALCQSAGLPPLMPPVLCAAEATRQLELTRTVGFETALGIVGQNNEQQIELRDLLNLSRGIGIRTGTELYADYLRESSRSFAEVIGMAATLLEQLNTISFPTEMCPISPGLPSPISSASGT